MPWFRTLADLARRLLGPPLGRLHDTLDRVGGRLRQAIAAAVARAAAGAVREAVATLLADPGGSGPTPPLPPDERRPGLPGAPGRPLWPPAHQGLGPGGHRDPEDDPDAGWGDLDDAEEPDEAGPAWPCRRAAPPDPTPAPAKPREGRWPRALAAGCHAAAWWLTRRPRPLSLLAALGVGLAAALAALFGGPAGAGVAGTALALLALADTARSGAALAARAAR